MRLGFLVFWFFVGLVNLVTAFCFYPVLWFPLSEGEQSTGFLKLLRPECEEHYDQLAV